MSDKGRGKGHNPYGSEFKPYVEMGEAQKQLKDALAKAASSVPKPIDNSGYTAPANYTRLTAEQVTETRIIAERISAQLELVIELLRKLADKS